jgi:hypothetical protein
MHWKRLIIYRRLDKNPKAKKYGSSGKIIPILIVYDIGPFG